MCAQRTGPEMTASKQPIVTRWIVKLLLSLTSLCPMALTHNHVIFGIGTNRECLIRVQKFPYTNIQSYTT